MRIYILVVVSCIALLQSIELKAEPVKTASINDLKELREAIDSIRLKSNTPGIAVGVFQADKDDWEYYSGLANIENRQPINANSQFRFGSISKMFVSLAMLKLVDEGKVSLSDTLSSIAPEIEFSNPWEASHPIKIMHLLNHSSGWDSPHFVETRVLSNTPVQTIDALRLHPHSRMSRWQPGSRVAYNNTGFLAAAYVIEKVSGMAFERYIQVSFFNPLNMRNSGYYYSDIYRESAVTLYFNHKPRAYAHLNNRAAGGLNSSIGDMLKFIKLLALNGASSIASKASLEAFKNPFGTQAASQGLAFTWGLGNQIFHANGVSLYGHEGSLRGTNSILVYSPDHAFAYLIVANSNSPAVAKIHALLANYLTKDIETPAVLPQRKLNESDAKLTGWYKKADPISDTFSLMQTIIPLKLSSNNINMTIKPLIGGSARTLIPDAKEGFKHATIGALVMVTSKDPSLSNSIYYGPNTFTKTNVVIALSPFVIVVFWLVMTLSGVVFMLIWLPRKLFSQSIPSNTLALRAWPLAATSFAIVTLLCARYINNSADVEELSGTMSAPSVLIFLSTIGFFVASLYSVWVFYRDRSLAINKGTKWHAALFVFANLALALLLLGQGWIGLRLWT